MGIGAYQPEWFMESNHMSPTNAIQAFDDMNAQYMVPMHYGCFDLSNESLEDPIRVYQNIKLRHPKSNQLLVPKLGENIF
jgi:L-ascorbate metabolism protein UlaG (beta-lactamase superfamily)